MVAAVMAVMVVVLGAVAINLSRTPALKVAAPVLAKPEHHAKAAAPALTAPAVMDESSDESICACHWPLADGTI